MPKRSDDILVLDDEVNYAEMLADLLRKQGFSTDVRTEPADALEAIRKRPYSLIVSDFKMPELDGAEFLKRVRDMHPDLPVIMISGFMNTPELLRVANIGVTLVLEKPFDTEVFFEHVRRFADPVGESRAMANQMAAPTPPPARRPSVPQHGDYPEGPLDSSDVSEVSRIFLQALWEGVSKGVVGLVAPRGAETPLILRDVGRWVGLRAPAQRISAAELRSGDPLQLEPDYLTVLDVRLSHNLDDLQELIELARAEMPRPSPLIVLLPDDYEIGSAPIHAVKILPLYGRPEDLAYYTRQIIGRRSPPMRLTPEAVRVLLAYEWPVNYDELHAVLQLAMAETEGNEIDAETLSRAIHEGGGAELQDLQEANLAQFLRRRQKEFLKQNPDPAKGHAADELLFPDLLEGRD